MAEDTIKHLVVGGPHDGRFYEMPIWAKTMRQPIPQSAPLVSEVSPTATIEVAEYERQTWRAEDETFHFYVPIGQSNADTMRRLIKRYSTP